MASKWYTFFKDENRHECTADFHGNRVCIIKHPLLNNAHCLSDEFDQRNVIVERIESCRLFSTNFYKFEWDGCGKFVGNKKAQMFSDKKNCEKIVETGFRQILYTLLLIIFVLIRIKGKTNFRIPVYTL